MKKIVMALLFALIPFSVYGEELYEISYNEANVVFTIDEEEWKEKEIKNDVDIIDTMWESNCGTVSSGIIDLYNVIDEEDLEGLSRSDINYSNLFVDENYMKQTIDTMKKETPSLRISSYKYVDYNMKFIHVIGSMKKSGYKFYVEQYITVNNGYYILLQYLYTPSMHSGECNNSIQEIAESLQTKIDTNENENENITNLIDFNIYNIIIGLLITFISYVIYPFIRIVIMKKQYTKEKGKKMILWNSIIVGGIFLVLTTLIYGSSGTWSAGPAFLYYAINSGIWGPMFIKKKDDTNNQEKSLDKKNNKTQEEIIEEEFICDNCGAVVKENDTKCSKCGLEFVSGEDIDTTLEEVKIIPQEKVEKELVCDNCGCVVTDKDKKCPHCGEVFEKEEKEKHGENIISVDQKYNDLTKLKELLDKEIITKEEFEKEKKKILKK